MAATPTNILQQVQTYQRSSLGLLENMSPFISEICNTKFKNFQDIQANLGSSVTFDRPPRFTTSNGLVATFQPAAQLTHTLTCDQAANTSFEFTAQERLFNVDKEVDSYMKQFGRSAVAEMANYIESNVALNANSHVPVNSIVNGQTVPTGALYTNSGPYRFFGDGSTAINSFNQLSQMLANYLDFGAAKTGLKVVLPTTIVPQIVSSGLNQFAPRRNDEMVEDWLIGNYGGAEFYRSNLLPNHTAGTAGDSAQTLTVVSTNDPTGANITQITFSGVSASDANCINSGDLIEFNDGVSGQPNMRFLTWIGHNVCRQSVQIRATADAASTGGSQVTISFYPALVSTPGANQNINNNIVAGMQASVLPSHTCGLLIGGDAMFLAMPRLPNQSPYATSAEYDPDLGVSMRLTYGSVFGQNQLGMIYDGTWGSTVVPEYAMRVIFPLTQ
ncbi:MAG: hypothetical protein A3E87_01655 [Gammaproteobacteria bacterium RIFCSPHIGHO2_12_FULL_35_23]|nr:MAG: hypothetical protein A3E87_01655 [Gammaproteobacteria bacterium RIFCSPHIGHO2_12_FULL_35_23]